MDSPPLLLPPLPLPSSSLSPPFTLPLPTLLIPLSSSHVFLAARLSHSSLSTCGFASLHSSCLLLVLFLSASVVCMKRRSSSVKALPSAKRVSAPPSIDKLQQLPPAVIVSCILPFLRTARLLGSVRQVNRRLRRQAHAAVTERVKEAFGRDWKKVRWDEQRVKGGIDSCYIYWEFNSDQYFTQECFSPRWHWAEVDGYIEEEGEHRETFYEAVQSLQSWDGDIDDYNDSDEEEDHSGDEDVEEEEDEN